MSLDLTTSWIGLVLNHPLMVGASPLVADLDMVRRLEDAGTSAIVMHSLFEEQITGERQHLIGQLDASADAHGEASSYLPNRADFGFALGPEEYLEHLRRIRAAVAVPVIASLNGTTLGGWLDYAARMEEAGATALELNVYSVAADSSIEGGSIEAQQLEMVREVRKVLHIPFALKLSPFYSSLAHFVRAADNAGANGFVLFNRFYQPDLDPEALDVRRSLRLSDSSELPLRLRWLAILSPLVRGSLAAGGGIHSGIDAVKALMAGADAVQMTSAVLQHGPDRIGQIKAELERWMEEHGYETLADLCGALDLSRCPDPSAYERANYMAMLQSWKGR